MLYRTLFPKCHGTAWSDHTVDPITIYNSLIYNPLRIELHFDLEDMKGVESSHGHCWSPSKAKEMFKGLNENYERRAESREGANLLILPWEPFDYENECAWRADPEDGMRPLKKFRKQLL
jgi:N-acetylneuraminate synthase